MARLFLPFTTRSYKGRTPIAVINRLVNLYPEVTRTGQNATNGPSVVLIAAPGCRPFANFPGEKRVHAMHSAANHLWVVTEDAVFRVDNDGSPRKIMDQSFGPNVSMADNGKQLWFTDGKKGYVVQDITTVTPDLIEITDGSFLTASSTVFIDGYSVWSRRGDDEFFWSEINDATVYDGLDFATVEGAPDKLRRIIAFERELWMFGENTIEIWGNTGDVDAPFQRLGNAFIQLGCKEGNSVAIVNRDLYWIGDDLSIYRTAAKSYRPVRISEHQGIEHDMYQYGVEGAYAFGASIEGHQFYWLTLPSANKTWVYDELTGSWHERSSLRDGRFYEKQDPIQCWEQDYGQHFATSGVMHNGYPYIGGFGAIYRLDLDYFRDDGQRIFREAVTNELNLSERSSINSLELEFQRPCDTDFTRGECNCKTMDLPDADPNAIVMEFSDDLGRKWKGKSARHLSIGDNNYRATYTRLGVGRRRAYRWRTFFDGPIVFSGAYIETEDLKKVA